jgi:signal transduction histidine kinase
VSAAEGRVAERAAAAELVTQAEERAQAFVRSNVELEQFALAASHDLQEPLRKIRMFGDKLQTTLGDDLSEEAASSLERMLNASERMQRLINDLLDFSRVGHKGQEFEPVDLDRITKEVITDLEARIVELSARVDVTGLPIIDADKTQMRQLAQNLISNALKFNREGVPPVIRIRGEIVTEPLLLSTGEPLLGDVCRITIQDNGIGFAKKDSERVFTAFERLHGHSEYEGTGIGLAIVRKIVERHGGSISASGAEGQGAKFTVMLPVSHEGTPEKGGIL